MAAAVSHALRISSLVLLTMASAGSAGAQALPTLTAPVNDFAHVIDGTSAAQLDRRIRALRSSTGDAVVVATVQSFAPYGSIEEYAVRLFEKAAIGQKDKDNGLLVVLALNERRVRIEVGYGLEEFITDGFAGETIREVMLPEFRAGRYGDGLLAGTTRLIARIAEKRGVTLPDVPPVQPSEPRSFPIQGVILGVIVLIVVARLIRRSGGGGRGMRRRGWPGPWSGWNAGVGPFGAGGMFGGGLVGFGGSGSSGGGGFGGFGGGRSGGGGASGGW
jgi:uncharacterized protein